MADEENTREVELHVRTPVTFKAGEVVYSAGSIAPLDLALAAGVVDIRQIPDVIAPRNASVPGRLTRARTGRETTR